MRGVHNRSALSLLPILMKARDWTHLFKRYRGKWVALKDDERTVAGSGSSLKAAKTAAEKDGVSNPILMRIPKKVTNFVGGSC